MFPLGDTLLNKLSGLKHLESNKAIERREGRIPDVIRDGLRGGRLRDTLVFYSSNDFFPLELLAGRQMNASLMRDYPAS